MTAGLLIGGPTLAQSSAAAPVATLDERLGCGMMFVSFDEMVKVIPALGQGLGSNREGGVAMMRMMGTTGALTYNAAFAEAAAQGAAPADTHRRAIAFIGERFGGVKDARSGEGRRVMMMLFNRCATVVAGPAS